MCPLAKLRRLSFVSSNNMAGVPFDLIHYDVWGPYHVPTYGGKQYFFTIVDDCTRFTWTYLLHAKSEVTVFLVNFFGLVEIYNLISGLNKSAFIMPNSWLKLSLWRKEAFFTIFTC